MCDNELISVIIPIYNSEIYLREGISRVLKQTYNNIELILINDGSTDKSLEICKEFEKKDSRVKVYSQENKGVSSARNLGLENANGKYIVFIDSDDNIKSEFLKNLHTAIKLNDCEVAVENTSIYKKNINKSIILEKENILKELFLERKFWAVLHGKIIDRKVIGEKRFNIKMSISEDLDFLYRVFLDVNRLIIIPPKEYIYTVRNDSLSHKKFDLQKWNSEFELVDGLIKQYKNDKNLKECIVSRYLRINSNIIKDFNLTKEELDFIKGNMKKYKHYFCFFGKSDLKERIKIIITYYILSGKGK
ncbi:MAG: glycosyltransferase family 2 protein [Clostridia bacterium]|nr:glycosyltransferase family 2 protein [Clostridia bacterium]